MDENDETKPTLELWVEDAEYLETKDKDIEDAEFFEIIKMEAEDNDADETAEGQPVQQSQEEAIDDIEEVDDEDDALADEEQLNELNSRKRESKKRMALQKARSSINNYAASVQRDNHRKGNFRTNINKINALQKDILMKFMIDHPNLAKNHLSVAASRKLWEQLSKKLNDAGPPIKDSKLWRKVFADQKHQIKKKFSFNKKTGGKRSEEKFLTAAEEQLFEATGIDPSVERLSVKSFQIAKPESTNEQAPVKRLKCVDEDSDNFSVAGCATKKVNEIVVEKIRCQEGAESKLTLLKANIQAFEESQATIISKLDKLIELKERSLAIKEVEHAANMAAKKIELEILNIKLNKLHNK